MVDSNAAALAMVTAAVTLQALAAIGALRIGAHSPRRLPWVVLGVGLALMAARRSVPLWHALSGRAVTAPLDPAYEGLGLVISVVMFAAVAALRQLILGLRRTEQEVRASERRYRRLFEAHGGVNLLVDVETGRVIDANRAAEDFYGLSRDQLTGRTLMSLSAAPEPAARLLFDRVAASGGVFIDRHRDAAGRLREVEVRAGKVDVGQDQTGTVHAVVADITERTATEQTLRTANEELRRWVIDLERHRHDSEVHLELNALLQSCEAVGEVSQLVQRLAPALFPDGSGALYLDEGQPGALRCWARWGADAPPDREFSGEECWAFHRGQLHITEDPSSGLLCPHLLDGYHGLSLCLPVRAHGGTPGVITLRGSRRLRETSGQRQARLLADTVGLAVVNLRLRDTLRDQSTHDALTGLYNRRYLEETLARELARADRSADAVALLMIDLDHFKRVNDRFGHAAGDRVLQAVADLLRRHLRAGDVLCRYGGEEFAVVMPGAGPDLALERAGVLRRAAHAVDLPGPGPTRGGLSLSVGVAVFPDHARLAADLVRQADDALYEAKRGGRDRVVLPPRRTLEVPAWTS
jgi:diguanylate cyclase (GGDEF)-like protein/PAS domain S-box-containing protein